MFNEKFTFCFKITIKWNLTKSHATRSKPSKYKKQKLSALHKKGVFYKQKICSEMF